MHRREQILEHLDKRSFAAVSDLARELQCSEMTIRRDLSRLEAEGSLKRSHGGATTTRRITLEFAMAAKAAVCREQKLAIGRAAAGLIESGERVIIDTGTTTLALARALSSREDISVVTTSLAVVSALLSAPGIECILVGGTVRENSPDLYGPLVEENLVRIHADRAFIGCDGISAKGILTTTDPRIARATELMVKNAQQVILLADSSKANHNAFISFGKFDQLDYLITDKDMPVEILDVARDAGVETILVDVGK